MAGPVRRPRPEDIPAPWDAIAIEPHHAAAVKALSEGRATSQQQKAAIEFLLMDCCQTYGMSFRPGPDGARESDFAEGKRWVGNTWIRARDASVEQLTQRRNATDEYTRKRIA